MGQCDLKLKVQVLLQERYKKLLDSSAVPQTLFTDLVRIARLAKVGQSNLYNTIRQSCSVSGGSTASFTSYVKALDLLVSARSGYPSMLVVVPLSKCPRANARD